MHILLHMWHPSYYSCYKPSHKSWMRKNRMGITKNGTYPWSFIIQIWVNHINFYYLKVVNTVTKQIVLLWRHETAPKYGKKTFTNSWNKVVGFRCMYIYQIYSINRICNLTCYICNVWRTGFTTILSIEVTAVSWRHSRTICFVTVFTTFKQWRGLLWNLCAIRYKYSK
jgi:hypothetical protein